MSIANLAAALTKAQATGAQEESIAIAAYARAHLPANKPRPGRTPVERFFSMVVTGVNDCWYWRGCRDEIGYGRTTMLGENKAHRAAWTLFNGRIPDGMKVLHKCDVRGCVNPEHLFLGTQADNVADMMKKGRHKSHARYGESNPMSVLTEEKVLKMRDERVGGVPYYKIAAKHGVSTMTAYRAITGQSWKKI